MITVQLVRIDQCLDLKTKAFEHVIKMELPNGVNITAVVDEVALEQLMLVVAADEQIPQSATQAAPLFDALQERDTQPIAGGFVEGDYDGEAAQIFGATEPLAEVSEPSTRPAQPQQLQPPQQIRIKTVPKTEYGYPIVSGGVAAGAIVSEAMEESGVPQI